MEKFILNAKNYACNCHSRTNHTYDGKPYSTHLGIAYSFAEAFIHLVDEEDRQNVLAAIWCHDLMEDCRQSYSDIVKATNVAVAEIVRAVTSDIRGRNRKERMSPQIYQDIRDTKNAAFVKICDRIANIYYGKQHGSSMLEKYIKEDYNFRVNLLTEKNAPMFSYIEGILKDVIITPALELPAEKTEASHPPLE